MTKPVDSAAIAAENEIYVRLGRTLLAMLAPEESETWSEILLHVDHVAFPDSPEAYVMQITLVGRSGEQRLMVARPEIMHLSQELERLCVAQSGKAWRAYDFRVFRSERGSSFQCRYTYADTLH